jgi:hypothetical protein
MTLIRRVLALDPCGELNKELMQPRHCWAVMPARPDNRSTQVLFADVLEALGKRTMSSYGGRAANHTEALAFAWLAAGTIGHLAVRDAQLLDPRRLRALCTLTAACGTTTWLIDETHPNDRRAATRDTLAIGDATESELLAARHASTIESEPVRYPESQSRLPDVHFLAFLPMAKEQLSPEDFDALLPAYRHALDTTRDWLTTETSPTEEAFAHHLHRLTAATIDFDDLLVLTRGAQAGAFLAGWNARIDANRFAHRGAGQILPVTLDSTAWAALGTLVRPADAAACVLAVRGLTVDQIAAISWSDVSADGDMVSVNGERRAVPTEGRVLLRAQHLHRNLSGALSDQYLAAGTKDPLVTPKRVGALLHAVARDTGVVLRARHTARTVSERSRWTHRLGVSLTPIAA